MSTHYGNAAGIPGKGDMNEGEGVGLNAVKELPTKKLAYAIGRSMAAKVVVERNLWSNLSGIKEKDKPFLLDSPLSPPNLFGDTVNQAGSCFLGLLQKSSPNGVRAP